MSAITVLVERRYLDQLQPRQLVRALRERGDEVTVVHDQEPNRVWDCALRSAQIVVARGRSARLIEGLRVAALEGIPTIDRYESVAAVRDKRIMTVRLQAAGLAIPRTWLGTAAEILDELAQRPASSPRLIVKPAFGDNSQGIEIIDDAGELAGMAGQLVVQELVTSDGVDVKLYVIGQRVWAVRKPSPVVECAPGSRLGPIPVTDEMRALALDCGAVFGLTVYGVDCLRTERGLVVIEVNDFPNYTSVPDAAANLAAHLDDVAGS